VRIFLVVVLVCIGADAQMISVSTNDGQEHEVSFTNRTLSKSGVELNSGGVLEFGEVTAIRTDDFGAYEKAVKLTGRGRAGHLTVAFTGEEEVNVLRLQKLEKQRQGAGVARGAGGFMMLFGVLSGDRDVRAAGLISYGAETIAGELNTDTTTDADLQKQRKKQSEDLSLEEHFRLEWGNEVVNGVIVLLDRNYRRATALASASENSSDASYRLAAVWLKAIIEADRGNTDAAQREYEKLVVLDPELDSVDAAHAWMERLLGDLNAMRAA
jgi:hypothetical protein